MVPAALAASHQKFSGAAGRAWVAAVPALAADLLGRWELTVDGAATCGAVALVLPVRSADGSAGVLKMQPVDEETVGEPVALRAWAGVGAVRLVRHDPESGAMLLERLDAQRSLATVADDLAALTVVGELLVALNSVPAPAGLRRLADVAAGTLARVADLPEVPVDPADRSLISYCAGALADLIPTSGDRLLHWDLHFDNVLSRPGDGPGAGWVAIDPKPLAGDSGFELLPALHNRWDEVVATGDVPRAVRRRFDLLTEVLGLDRQRAVGWTLARILTNVLWEVEHQDTTWHAGPDRAIARVLIG